MPGKEKLHKQLISQFTVMTSTYLERYPVSSIEFNQAYAVDIKTFVKSLIGIWYFIFYKDAGRGRQYYFQGLRNLSVLQLFLPEQVVIIGGIEERHTSRKLGYRFLWNGGLVSAVLLASKANISWPLRIQLTLFLRKFSKTDSWFFLIEDTLPVGSSFALLGNQMNKPTILLQHGFITGTEIMIDGRHCRYCMLYNLVLEKFVKSSDAIAFELGPAFDARPDNRVSREVILVGTGGKGYEPDQYFSMLSIYASIAALLQPDWGVYYRPHPNEDPADYVGRFERVDKRTTADCLSGGRKVFIGVLSTLLYEAQYFGHSIIAIKDPAEPTLLYKPDAELRIDRIAEVVSIVPLLAEKMKMRQAPLPRPLSERFLGVLAKIESARA